MTYIYYDSVLDCLYLTEYHWGKATTQLPSAFDGVKTETRRTEFKFLFEYVGRL